MIKARIDQQDGHPVVLLGLSRANMRLLLAGKPMHVKGDVLGVDVDVLIIGGETEPAMHTMIQQAWGGRSPTQTYTCCEKHAAEAGVPHLPGPDTACMDTAVPDPDGLPDV